MRDNEEHEARIKVVDRRRFYLDDDGEVHEREERVVELGAAAREELPEAPAPAEGRASLWQWLKRKLVRA